MDVALHFRLFRPFRRLALANDTKLKDLGNKIDEARKVLWKAQEARYAKQAPQAAQGMSEAMPELPVTPEYTAAQKSLKEAHEAFDKEVVAYKLAGGAASFAELEKVGEDRETARTVFDNARVALRAVIIKLNNDSKAAKPEATTAK